MKRTALLAAAILLCAAPFASATVAIMKDAKAKDKTITSCKSCHSAMPATKANLTDAGKKWAPAPAKK